MTEPLNAEQAGFLDIRVSVISKIRTNLAKPMPHSKSIVLIPSTIKKKKKKKKILTCWPLNFWLYLKYNQ